MAYPNLLEQNLYSECLKDKFLLIGSCLPDLYPEVVEKFEKEWGNVFSLCLEEFHYNQLVAKLFNILSISRIKKVGFLTVDGSPHCIQMHFASKYLKRGLKEEVEFEHYVVRKDGSVFKVEMEEIDKTRDLSALGERVDI